MKNRTTRIIKAKDIGIGHRIVLELGDRIALLVVYRIFKTKKKGVEHVVFSNGHALTYTARPDADVLIEM